MSKYKNRTWHCSEKILAKHRKTSTISCLFSRSAIFPYTPVSCTICSILKFENSETELPEPSLFPLFRHIIQIIASRPRCLTREVKEAATDACKSSLGDFQDRVRQLFSKKNKPICFWGRRSDLLIGRLALGFTEQRTP
jgi:hypothetical protein